MKEKLNENCVNDFLLELSEQDEDKLAQPAYTYSYRYLVVRDM